MRHWRWRWDASDRGEEPVQVSDLVAALRSCGAAKDLECGRRVFDRNSGIRDIEVANSLLRMYGRCGSLDDARDVFGKMPSHSTASWNSILQSLVENRTYVALLMACSSLADDDGVDSRARCLELGKAIHAKAFESTQGKLSREIFVGNALIEMYSRCGSMSRAREVFQEMEIDSAADVVSWTTLMLGFVRNGDPQAALQLFRKMNRSRCCEPDSRAFVAAISACSSLADREEATLIDGRRLKIKSLENGSKIHSMLQGREISKEQSGSLVDMYCRCGDLDAARDVFDRTRPELRNVVLWTALIQGYADNGESESALRLFWSMDAAPNSRTFVAAMAACAGLAAKEHGRIISGKLVKVSALESAMDVHARAADAGFDLDLFVANTSIDMYSKCGSLPDARRSFDRLDRHSIVSWTALILGYAENGENELGLELFRRASCETNSLTYAAAINACANLGALESGRRIHAEGEGLGFDPENDLPLANSLLNLYSKCGCMIDAERIFGAMSRRDLVSWSSLISGYSGKGESRQVYALFQKMMLEGLDPDSVTYLSVLTACSHAGLVTRARECFDEMREMRIEPEIRHYHCLIDALGRANLVEEAVELAETGMPWDATAVTWTTILSCCRKWKNVAVGKRAFEAVMKLERSEGAAYVLMANMFIWPRQVNNVKKI